MFCMSSNDDVIQLCNILEDKRYIKTYHLLLFRTEKFHAYKKLIRKTDKTKIKKNKTQKCSTMQIKYIKQ